MAARRVKGSGGRLRLTVLLIAFLAISGTVILRRSYGNRAARELIELDARRAGLVGERLRLEAEIRAARSRNRIQPIATDRLGMHIPPDSLVIYIPPPRRHEGQ